MDNLSLHSDGMNEHLDALKQDLDMLIKKIKKNDNLSLSEKKEEILNAEKEFKEKEKKIKKNLY